MREEREKTIDTKTERLREAVIRLREAVGKKEKTWYSLLEPAAALLLSAVKMPGGSYPLGIAFAAAAERNILPVFLCAAAGNLLTGDNRLMRCAATLLCFLLRGAANRWLLPRKDVPGQTAVQGPGQSLTVVGGFHESITLRLGIGALCTALCGISVFLENGLTAQTVLCGAGYPAFGALYVRGFCPERERKKEWNLRLYALLTAAVLALSGKVVLGFSLAVTAAAVLTLSLARWKGPGTGCIGGILLGLCCDALYAPAFGAAGFLGGVFFTTGTGLGTLVAVAAAGGYAAAMGGFAAVRGVVPDIIVGGALFYPFGRLRSPRSLLGALHLSGDKPAQDAEEAEPSPALSEEEWNRRLTLLGETFASLSDSLSAVSAKTRRPTGGELNGILRDMSEKYCSGCEQEGVCYGDCYEKTVLLQRRLTDALIRGEAATGTDGDSIGVPVAAGCIHYIPMQREWKRRIGTLHREKVQKDKTGFLAAVYENMADLLLDSKERFRREGEVDVPLSRKLSGALSLGGFRAEKISVVGKRECKIYAYGIDMKTKNPTPAEVSKICKNTTARTYALPLYSIEGERVTARVLPRPALGICTDKYQRAAQNSALCGDDCLCFWGEGGYFYSLLCDGMGSGSEASLTASISTLFLRKMLEAGAGTEVSLKMLNTLLRGRGGECSVTVDLLQIDPLTGKGTFTKCGAAPSFAVRQGKVYKIASSTAPLGILPTVSRQSTTTELSAGDLLVQLSDGVIPTPGQEECLADALQQSLPEDLSGQAQALFARLPGQQDCPGDDCSLLLTRIEEPGRGFSAPER